MNKYDGYSHDSCDRYDLAARLLVHEPDGPVAKGNEKKTKQPGRGGNILMQSQNKRESAGRHILICLSSSTSNARVIHAAAKMAAAFQGTLTALFVETPA